MNILTWLLSLFEQSTAPNPKQAAGSMEDRDWLDVDEWGKITGVKDDGGIWWNDLDLTFVNLMKFLLGW